MKILKFKKKNQDQYEIIFENNAKLLIHDDVIIKYNLLNNKEINNDLLTEINKDNNFYDIYSKCVRYISIRIRSEKEMVDYLKKKLCNNITIDEIIIKLKNNKLINDELFAKSFINDKLLLTNYGPKKIKIELEKHDIDSNIIDKYLDNVDRNIFYEKINKIIDRQINSNNKYSKNMIKTKIQNYLNDLGYPKIFYSNILNNYEIKEDDEILKKELIKEYKKLSNKYEGNQLRLKIKQKLYQKGFNINKIDNILDKTVD